MITNERKCKKNRSKGVRLETKCRYIDKREERQTDRQKDGETDTETARKRPKTISQTLGRQYQGPQREEVNLTH